MTLMKIPMRMLNVLYSARSESKVVNVPVPAINGKASGITDAVEGTSSLYKRIPRIISRERKNKTNDPAIAKSETSIPIKCNMGSPTNRKPTMIQSETKEARGAFKSPTF